MYGFQDAKELEQGDYGNFGKNSATVTKFEYNPNAGKDGAQQDAIDVWLTVGSKEYRKRIFPVTRAFIRQDDGSTKEVTDSKDPAFVKASKLLNAEITDAVSAIVGEEKAKMGLSRQFNSFAEYAKAAEDVVKSNPNWNKTPIDVFLQYQFTIRGENTMTFLELPRDQKHGRIFSAHTGNDFKRVEGSSSLKYVNEGGLQHPFVRSEWFMNSAFANQIKAESDSTSSDMGAEVSTDESWG